MSNDTNYTIRIEGETGEIDRLLRFLEEKKTQYEAWQKKTEGLSPEERHKSFKATLKEYGLKRSADFVTWGFSVKERKDFIKKTKLVLGGWANENSQNNAISGEVGELAGLYRKFPDLEYSVEYNDEYSEGTCSPPDFEKEESDKSATTLDGVVMDLYEDGGEQTVKSCLDMDTKDYKCLDQDDNIAERISKLEGRIDLTGLVELSEKDAKFFAKSPHVILSPEMEKVVARYRGKN